MVNNSRHLGRIVTKSLTGQPLNWRDSLRLLWATTDPKRRRIGGAWVWAVRGAFAVAIYGLTLYLALPLIGGFALLLAAMVMVALGSHWLS